MNKEYKYNCVHVVVVVVVSIDLLITIPNCAMMVTCLLLYKHNTTHMYRISYTKIRDLAVT